MKSSFALLFSQRKTIFILIYLLVPYFSISQGSFSINISNNEPSGISGQIELNQGQYIIFYGRNNNPNQLQEIKGYLLKINDFGDTSSVALNSGDTVRYIHKMTKISDNEFLAIGNQIEPPYTNIRMLVLKLDSNLNTIWHKSFQLNDFGVFYSLDILKKSNELFYLTGSIWLKNFTYSRPYLIKINAMGDTVSTKYLEGLAILGYYNSVFSPDSSQIWMFGPGYGTIGTTCLLATDTNFNIKSIKSLGGNDYGYVNPPLMGKLFNNDSVLILGTYLMELQHPDDDDIGIRKTDTALQPSPIHYFGAVDTVDYAADALGLDFINNDSIFYAGTHNIIPFYYSSGVSWIMTGMLDRNLQPRYERYYGGDAYYRTSFITATMDGGSLISAYKFYPASEHTDLLILKLNPDGLVTGSDQIGKEKMKQVLLYPNPGSDHLFIRTGLKNAVFNLTDTDGKLLLSKRIDQGNTTIGCASFSRGVYFYTVTINDNVVESGKWIKY